MNIIKLVVLILVTLHIDGCATYKAGKIPVADYSSIKTKKLTIFIKSSFIELDGEKVVVLNEEKKNRNSVKEYEFIEQFEKTGLYSIVGMDDDPDVTMDLTIEDSETVPKTCILTFLSLWMIPCSVPTEYSAKATIVNNKTNTKNNITVNDGFTIYHSLLLMPFAPFNTSHSVGQEVRSNISTTIAIKAYEASMSGCSYVTECKTGFSCDESSRECKKIASEESVSSKSLISQKVKENNSNVNCKTDADCGDGRFCWSIVGGGHECQVKTVINEKPVIQTYDSNFVNPLNLKSLPDTVSFEHTERVKRLARLSRQLDMQQLPLIQQLQVTSPNATFPIPVIRFHFDERTFFDSGSSTIRPESNKIIDMLAEQMKQDMPDTSLVILGHTDSVGSDENNNNLSINRSASVMQQLAQRGVNLKQMSTVGIGETQPIATNATDDGRSQNRRVEFVLSRFEEANYVAIEQFPRNTEWLNNHPETQLVAEPIIQEKLSVKTKQVVHVKPKATPVVHHNTEAKKLVVFKPTKEMLVKSNPETTVVSEPTTMLKESTRTVTIIPAEIVHIIPPTQN